MGQGDFHLGSFIVRPERLIIEGSSGSNQIKPKAMEVLVHLANANGRVVPRRELFEKVWLGAAVSDDTLTQCIVELRKALGDSAKRASFIETIPRRGLRLIPPVLPATAQGAQPEPGPTGSERLLQSTISPTRKIALIATVLFVTIGLVVMTVFDRDDTVDSAKTLSEKSIAVLPFVNLSSDKDQEYFADGLSEQLLMLLAQIPELRVVPRSSSFYYKGKSIKLSQVGRELNVHHILEGSVMRSDNIVRVAVRLNEAESESHVWSRTWERTLDDIFAIQEDIAEAVTEELRIRLHADTRPAHTTSPQTYELYLQSRPMMLARTRPGAFAAERLLKQALALDENYAPAHVALARTYSLGISQGNWHPHTVIPLARAAAKRALRLDPKLARARMVLAAIAAYYDFDLAAARAEINAAMSMAPRDADILYIASLVALIHADYEETIRLAGEAARLDPWNALPHSFIGHGHLFMGRLNEAHSAYSKAVRLNPEGTEFHYRLGQTLISQKRYVDALNQLNKEKRAGLKLAGRALTFLAMGDKDRANSELNKLLALDDEDTFAYEIGQVYAFGGNSTDAVIWLQRAVERRDAALLLIGGDPFMDPIRAEAGFVSVLSSIGRNYSITGTPSEPIDSPAN